MTLAVSTKGMERDIKSAFNRINPEAEGRRAGQKFSAGASGGVNLSGIQQKMASAGALGAKALGGALMAGVAVVGTAAATTLSMALSKGFERLKSIDDAKFKLTALGNSAADVQSIMDSALASVKGTAYGLGEAATIAASAVAAGVKPGQELTSYLKLTADAAAVAGTSLNDMGLIINQVRTSGAAYTEDLNQLAGRGIPIYQWLGKEAGVAAADVKKLAAEGKISSEVLEAAISKNIGGAAATMGQSFSGAVANANAALGRLGEALLKPLFGNASGGINSITAALDKMTAWINNNQGSIVTFWETIGVAALSTAQSILQSIGEITVAIGELVGGVGNIQGAALKIQAAAARFRGDGDEADRLSAESEAAFAWGEDIKDAGNKMLVAADSIDRGKESVRAWGEAARENADALSRLGPDAAKSTAEIKAAFAEVPTNVPIRVDAPGGEAVFDLLTRLGVQVREDNDKTIRVDAPMAPEVIRTLEALGFQVTTNNDKTITVKQVGAEDAGEQIDQAARDRIAKIQVAVDTAAAGVMAGAAIGAGVDIPQRRDGAIVPMAFGGLRQISKPQTAGIYQGRGAGTIFAEQETGGEAYIPLSPAKRGRSMQILAEVARLFGINRMADGGMTVEELKSFASRIQGRGYRWGGGSGNTFDSDCSGAQSTLANAITGASGRFSTATAAGELAARGFQTGDPPSGVSAYWVGWVNGGPGGGHMAATIVDPQGGNVNVEMGGRSGGGQFGGSAAGANGFPNRAWIALAGGDDPNNTSSAVMSASSSVTSARASVTSAQARLDQAQAEVDKLTAEGATAEKQAVAETKRDAAQTALDAAMEKQTAAETRLSEVKEKEAAKAETQTQKSAGMDGQGLGQSIVSGMLQTFGLDGSLFSNPMEWPNVKSVMAGLNFGGNLLNTAMGGQGGGPSLNGLDGFIKPIPNGATQPIADAPHAGSGAAPGVVVNGNIGMDPRQFTQRIDAHQNQAWRRNMSAVRPG